MEDVFGSSSLRRNRKYDKYETETQIVGLVLIKHGFSQPLSLNGKLYSTDLQNFQKIVNENLDVFFSGRVKGTETSNIKIQTISISIEDEERKNNINSKTKSEIISMIHDVAVRCGEIDIDHITNSCNKSRNKQFLIDMYMDLLETERNHNLGIEIE